MPIGVIVNVSMVMPVSYLMEYLYFTISGVIGMAKITVWSKQHENVWKVLQETGRYTVKARVYHKGSQRTFGAGSGYL